MLKVNSLLWQPCSRPTLIELLLLEAASSGHCAQADNCSISRSGYDSVIRTRPCPPINKATYGDGFAIHMRIIIIESSVSGLSSHSQDHVKARPCPLYAALTLSVQGREQIRPCSLYVALSFLGKVAYRHSLILYVRHCLPCIDLPE